METGPSEDESARGRAPGRARGLKWAARALLYPGALLVIWLGTRWAERGPGLTTPLEWIAFGGALALILGGAVIGRRYTLHTGRRLWF